MEKDRNEEQQKDALKALSAKAAKKVDDTSKKAGLSLPFKPILLAALPSLGILLAVQIAFIIPFMALNMIGATEDANSTLTTEQVEEEGREMIGNAVKDVWKSAKNNAKKAFNFLFGTNFSVGVADENFTSNVDLADVYELTENVGDYESAMTASAKIADLYLQDALDHRRNEVSSHTGKGIVTSDGTRLEEIDYDLTLANFDAQGNPFTNVNYAALIAAYAASDYTIDSETHQPTSNVNAYVQALKNGEPTMLKVEYTYINPETDEQYEDVQVTPVPVYNYKAKKITVEKKEYITYLKLQEEQDPNGLVKQEVTAMLQNKYDVNANNVADLDASIAGAEESIQSKQSTKEANNATIASDEKKIQEYEKQIDEYKEKKANSKIKYKKKLYQDKIDEYEKKISNLKSEISRLNSENETLAREISSLQTKKSTIASEKEGYQKAMDEAAALKTEIENGTKKASADMLEEAYMTADAYEITVYRMVKTKDGAPSTKDIDYISDPEGELRDEYVELPYTFGKDKYNGNYYMITGQTVQFPEIDVKYYATVELKPYSSTDVFEIFGIDPDATYEPSSSASESSQITNRERYNQYYDVISEQCEMLCGSNISPGALAHASGLSADEIQAYLDAMPAGTSGNRKEFVKNLLYLVGAVPYEFGGDPTGPGWNDNWWQPSAKTGYRYQGLDCSSFVQWGVWTVFGSRLSAFDSTSSICSSCSIIAEDQLMPGDLALQHMSNGTGNHVAVFIGYQDGKKLYVHLGGGGSDMPPEVTTSPFPSGTKPVYFRMSMIPNLEGNDRYTDAITPFGIASGDELYVITKTLIGECGDGGDGFRAVCEACHNHAISKGLSMFDQVTYGNGSYLEAYKRIFIEGDNYAREPTAADYAIVQQVMSGQRTIFPNDSKVMFWRGCGIMLKSPYVFIKNVGGNNFFAVY